MAEALRNKAAIERDPARPVALAVEPDGIPAELKALDWWVGWRYTWAIDKKGLGKWTKVPHCCKGGRVCGLASSTDAATWCSFAEALAAYQAGGLDGIGTVFHENAGQTGVDLDDAFVVADGSLKPWAGAIVAKLDSYAEVSPSGTGVKIWVRGKKPGDRCRKMHGDGEVEMYSSGRYFCVTGVRLDGSPATVNERKEQLQHVYDLVLGEEKQQTKRTTAATAHSQDRRLDLDDDALIEKAKDAKNGEDFRALWEGDTSGYPSHSEADLALANHLAFWTDGDADRIDGLFRRSGLIRPKWDERHGEKTHGQRTIEKALKDRGPGYRPVQQPTVNGAGRHPGNGKHQQDDKQPSVNEAADDPHRLARLFLDEHQHPDGLTLRYWREQFHRWSGGAYRALDEKELRAELCQRIKQEFDRLNRIAIELWEKAGRVDKKGKPEPKPEARRVTARLTADTMHALAGLTLLPGTVEQPTWLGGGQGQPCPAEDILACRNGLVSLPDVAGGRGRLCPHTPRFFSGNVLPYDFNPAAPRPAEWLAFLERLWPDDPQVVEALQAWFGCCLTTDTRQQKILMVVGPRRSGKGTIARVLRQLVGEANVCGPTLAGLGTNFGLQPLLGKSVAVISDARLSGRTDAAIVTERLLSISGEDAQTIDRKNLSHVTTKLAVRFIILTNELPRLNDPSGALVGRLILLRLTRSWYGNEDTGLTARLLTELPGILLWAVEGWRRLRERGHFVQPESGRKLISDMEDLSSPIGAFIRECCDVGPHCEVKVQDLFDSWKGWCEEKGRKDHGTEQTFGRDLRAALPTLDVRQPRTDEGRVRVYVGIGLCPRESAPP